MSSLWPKQLDPNAAGKVKNRLVEGGSEWDRDFALWFIGSKLTINCHLRLPSAKSLTWTFICLWSTLPNKKGRNISIRHVREDWETACRRYLKNIQSGGSDLGHVPIPYFGVE